MSSWSNILAQNFGQLAFKKLLLNGNGSSTKLEPSPHHSKVKGLSPTSAPDTGEENDQVVPNVCREKG